MPVDVAVEEPDTGIVGTEAQYTVSESGHLDGIAAHGNPGEVVGVAVPLAIPSRDYLEVAALERT